MLKRYFSTWWILSYIWLTRDEIEPPKWLFTPWYYLLLPPANEVWGKVIFSEACVKNSVHRGGGAWSGGSGPRGGSLVSSGGGVSGLRGGPGGNPIPGTATASGGTHPTGMYSCWDITTVSDNAVDILSLWSINKCPNQVKYTLIV